MTLESQVKRTTGMVYGEIMRDSGITLVDGKYIPGNELIATLRAQGVRASELVMLKDVGRTTNYGEGDVITGVQYHKFTMPDKKQFEAGIMDGGSSTYFFNPWKELMKSSSFGTFLDENFNLPAKNITF